MWLNGSVNDGDIQNKLKEITHHSVKDTRYNELNGIQDKDNANDCQKDVHFSLTVCC
jgi:hypothetical protein